MKLAVLVIVAACQSEGGGGDDYPIGPGGGGGPIVVGPGGGSVDAGAGDGGAGAGDGGVAIAGRACLLTDLRKIGDRASCAGTGAGGLTVTLGIRTATTQADGSFQITAPPGGGFTWRVDSGVSERVVTSLMPFGTDHTIPVVTTPVYGDLVTGNGMVPVDQEGSIVLRVVRRGAPVAGVTAALPVGVASNETRYDGTTPEAWSTSATGAAGVVWFAGVQLALTPPTTVRVTLSEPGAADVQDIVPVENGAITFATTELR